MSFVRILAAALVGGVVVFMWGYVSHTFLGVGEMAFDRMPMATEQVLAHALDESGIDHSMMMFPALPEGELSAEQMKAYEEVYEAGPRGIVLYDRAPMPGFFPKSLVKEFVSGTIAALMASIVAAGVRGGYAGRVATVTLMGLFAWVSIDISYWTWYRFTDGFAMAGLIDQGVGWLLAGLLIAAIARPSRVIVAAVSPA